jgi:hypothetical protein
MMNSNDDFTEKLLIEVRQDRDDHDRKDIEYARRQGDRWRKLRDHVARDRKWGRWLKDNDQGIGRRMIEKHIRIAEHYDDILADEIAKRVSPISIRDADRIIRRSLARRRRSRRRTTRPKSYTDACNGGASKRKTPTAPA